VLGRKKLLQANAGSRSRRLKPGFLIHERMTFLDQLTHSFLKSSNFLVDWAAPKIHH
jgi:hypothetical protein